MLVHVCVWRYTSGMARLRPRGISRGAMLTWIRSGDAWRLECEDLELGRELVFA
jgi:hypothetical protein